MRTTHCYYGIFFFVSIAMHHASLRASLWEDAKTWVRGLYKKHHEIIDQQYRCIPHSSLFINNAHGSIHIESAWDENNIVLSAKKSAQSPQALKACDIVHHETNNGISIVLETVHHDPESHARVDYTLVVPAHVKNINLEVEDGSIIIRDYQGTITAFTEHGDIDIHTCTGAITAEIATKGSIFINQAEGPVTATTCKGPITIMQSQNNVTAKTHCGRIRVYCKQLLPHNELWLQTKSGLIQLYVPTTINARLRAKTEYGNFTSQLPVTVNEFTTLLDTSAWRRFKQEISGMLGASGDARICLYSRDSNIEIKKIEA